MAAASVATAPPSAGNTSSRGKPAASPQAERAGQAAPVIWRQAPSIDDRASGGVCSHAEDELVPREVRADRDRLYIDVTHKAYQRSDDHSEAVPELRLQLDGCPVPATATSTAVERTRQTCRWRSSSRRSRA
jgi:hypothetical protein